MHSIDEMARKISIRYHDKIKKFCMPLFTHFGVRHFSYFKITNSGYFTILSSFPEWLEYYFAQEMHRQQPHFRQPQNLETGICIPKSIPDEHYQQTLEGWKEKFCIHPSLVFIHRKNDCVEGFGIDLNSSNHFQHALLVNEIPLLRIFTQKFYTENNSLLHELDNYCVNLTEILGKSASQDGAPVIPKLVDRNAFIREANLCSFPKVSISKRERELLLQLLNGAPASTIGAKLNISKRTVEHYMERLKNKLICHSKVELVDKARELEQLGYFTYSP